MLPLHNAILSRQFLRITYHPFVQALPFIRHIFPLLLKEYNNRWFLICWESGQSRPGQSRPGESTPGRETPQTLALDRITAMHVTAESFIYPKSFDSRTHFSTIFGVSQSGKPPEDIVLRFSKDRAKYVVTKKLWATQQEIWLPDGELEVRFLG